MKRHGISHGAATLVSTIAAALLTDLARGHLPKATRSLDSASRELLKATGLDYPPEVLSAVFVATLLALVWGLAFGFLEQVGKNSSRKKST